MRLARLCLILTPGLWGCVSGSLAPDGDQPRDGQPTVTTTITLPRQTVTATTTTRIVSRVRKTVTATATVQQTVTVTTGATPDPVVTQTVTKTRTKTVREVVSIYDTVTEIVTVCDAAVCRRAEDTAAIPTLTSWIRQTPPALTALTSLTLVRTLSTSWNPIRTPPTVPSPVFATTTLLDASQHSRLCATIQRSLAYECGFSCTLTPRAATNTAAALTRWPFPTCRQSTPKFGGPTNGFQPDRPENGGGDFGDVGCDACCC
ncbi:hypothetical protein QBC47DRAFT_415502 [Echria macrotheca]|uniref:Uncharacterized protein n=1 Tax=Echria macrotheca TaxID=438768 RepID=A0AAJ0B9J6_9PEZI|nr:hypothetical protein QBC47DRAFT_415502 [Echria macrotheca]